MFEPVFELPQLIMLDGTILGQMGGGQPSDCTGNPGGGCDKGCVGGCSTGCGPGQGNGS